MKKITIALLLIVNITVYAQNVGINNANLTPDPSAGLDVNYTDKGVLIPRVSLTGTNDITTVPTPATSLMVYNTATAGTGTTAVTPGYYYWDGTQWLRLLNTGNAGGMEWLLNGNAGTSAGTDFLGTTDAQDLVLKTNNTEQMRILTNGNVGIGTTTPSELLELSGGGMQLNGVYGIGFAGEVPSNVNVVTDGAKMYYDGNLFGTNYDALVIEKTDGNNVDPDGGIAFINKGSDNIREIDMVIRGSGYVGIGTTTPNARLHVNQISGVSGTALQVSKDFTGLTNEYAAFIGGTDVSFSNTGIYVLEKGTISFSDNTTNILNVVVNGISEARINGQGNVRIGGNYNASCNGISTGENNDIKLSVIGGYTVLGAFNSDPGVGGVPPTTDWMYGVGSLAIGKNRNGGSAGVDFWNTADPNNGSAALAINQRGFYWRNFQTVSGNCSENLLMHLDGNGNLTLSRFTTTGGQGFAYAWNIISDKRIKTNIKEIDITVLNKLLELKPKEYNIKDISYEKNKIIFKNSTNEKQIGLIAQEVYDLFPEFVYKPANETNELWAIDYSKFTPLLIKGYQYQSQQIKELKQEINDLKQEIKLIKEKLK